MMSSDESRHGSLQKPDFWRSEAFECSPQRSSWAAEHSGEFDQIAAFAGTNSAAIVRDGEVSSPWNSHLSGYSVHAGYSVLAIRFSQAIPYLPALLQNG